MRRVVIAEAFLNGEEVGVGGEEVGLELGYFFGGEGIAFVAGLLFSFLELALDFAGAEEGEPVGLLLLYRSEEVLVEFAFLHATNPRAGVLPPLSRRWTIRRYSSARDSLIIPCLLARGLRVRSIRIRIVQMTLKHTRRPIPILPPRRPPRLGGKKHWNAHLQPFRCALSMIRRACEIGNVLGIILCPDSKMRRRSIACRFTGQWAFETPVAAGERGCGGCDGLVGRVGRRCCVGGTEDASACRTLAGGLGEWSWEGEEAGGLEEAGGWRVDGFRHDSEMGLRPLRTLVQSNASATRLC